MTSTKLATEHPTLAWALAREISLRLRETIESLAEASFGSLRERLIRLLFEVATPTDGRLLAHTTQQQLARQPRHGAQGDCAPARPASGGGADRRRARGDRHPRRDGLRALGGHWYESRYWIAGLPRDPDPT